MGAEAADVDVAGHAPLLRGIDADDAVVLDRDLLDRLTVVEIDATLLQELGKGDGELAAVAGAVGGQAQPAHELVADVRKRRLGLDAALPVQHLEGRIRTRPAPPGPPSTP